MANIPELMIRLKEKSREELLVLMEQVLQQEPDVQTLLELLLELPQATIAQTATRPKKGRTIHSSLIKKQITPLFYGGGEKYRWASAIGIASKLSDVYDTGNDFEEAGEWANAQVVYSTIAEEAIAHYEEVDDEGDISQVIDDCAIGLVDCLNIQPTLPIDEQLNTAERKELLTTLLDIWQFSTEYASLSADIVGTIAQNVTEDERKMLAEWIRDEMKTASSWKHRKLIGLLADLEGPEQFSDEDLLEEYRKAGLYKELTAKLLQLNRKDEAFSIAQEKFTDVKDVTWFAEQLMLLDDTWREQVLTFVETRLAEVESARKGRQQDYAVAQEIDSYRRWLSEKYRVYGSIKKALDMEILRFHARLDEATYHSVQSLAQLLKSQKDLWTSMRVDMLKTLEQQKKWGPLISIYLAEGEVGHALSALEHMEKETATPRFGYSYYVTPGNYELQVAKAAEAEYPNDAIRLYQRIAEKLIDARGRDRYQQAVEYFIRVKQLYQAQEREAEWNTYITSLRNTHKPLRALREELDRRNL